ncbi:hypothetical protein AUK11_02425 [bacterium CG2_30_37_16]|nr:MAG: hypothetical protein AUK11_02425 [bacterium CG2_30_37_16]PIP30265.1 MAG: hypothetical protein COX25_05575 [bacterium (Candidatus Howlettbacteria) CG23_combo_of_CG06-09_8_20_14_all_37_9]PIY00097.1 MAG: hypothetical protein COZ22_01125 [bacterium (Candidatus Howlettbacteria) CG_4_10_14_3_um_filter_37_10]PJB06558.1 MAG: hypothetical protein CO123_01930 [bacterium (Candidatus Howlettbacteria) CG_4_9_14_3_um_filter_37_10]
MNERGTTLIELVIYIAILGIAVTGILYVTFPIIKVSKRNSAATETSQNARFVLDNLKADLGLAANITEPTVGIKTSDRLVLAMPDTTSVVYEINSGNVERKVYNGINLLKNYTINSHLTNITHRKDVGETDINYFKLVPNADVSKKPSIQISIKINYLANNISNFSQEYQTTSLLSGGL